MRNQAKKAFSLLLALVMCLSVMSVGAFAEGEATALPPADMNGVITLTSDVALTETVTIDDGQTHIINLNGYSICAQDTPFLLTHGELKFSGTGTVYESADNGYGAVVIKGSTDSTAENYSVLTVDPEVTLKGWAGVFIRDNNKSAYGVKVNLNGSKVYSPGKESDEHAGHAIYINGNINGTTGNVPEINIADNTEIKSLHNSGGGGIYAAGYAKWNIGAATVSGFDTGVEIRAGEMTVNGSNISASATSQSVNANGNGTTTVGAAIAVAQHTTKLPINLTIKNGSLKGHTALIVSNPENNPQADFDKVSVSVKGGTFNAGNYGIYVKQGTVNVSGGTIDSDNQGIRIEGNRAAGDTETKAAVKSVVNVSGTTSVTADSCGVFITGKGAELNVSGGSISGADYGISGNGRNDTGANFGGTSIEITGGSISSTGTKNEDGALYHPQAGKLTISGGTFTGANGIQLCSGEGLIGSIGGTTIVTATGTDGRPSKTDDGYINDGAALSIVNRSYPGGTPKLMVTGGSFTSHEPDAAVLAYTWSNKIDNKYKPSVWDTANQFFTITGGTFSSDPVYYDTNKYEFTGGQVVEKNTAPNVKVTTSLTDGKVAVTLTNTSTSDISFTGTEANEAKIDDGVLTAPMKDLNAKIVLNNGGYISIADQLRTVALSTDSNVTNEMKNVAKATLNFGEAAAAYFGVANTGYNYSVYGNSFMSELTSAAGVKTALESVTLGNANNQWLTGSEELGGLKYIGVSLVLKSNTSLRLNFRATDGKSYDDTLLNGNITLVRRDAGSNYYYAEIDTNILPQNLNKTYTVTGSNGFSVTVSPLSYAKIVLEKPAYNENEKLVTLARALYDYYDKASAAAPAVGN